MTPMTQAVGWALVHFVWQGTLVALGLAAGLALLRPRSAAVRYAASVGALALLLVLPAATALRSYPESSPVSPAPAVVGTAAAPAARPMAPAAAEILPASAPALRERLQPYLPSLLSVWLAGVVLLSVWHLGGWLQARRLTRVGTRPPRLALGADGGSLLRRIRRIAGVQDGTGRARVAWVAGALTLALLAAGAAFQEGARAALPVRIQVAGPTPAVSQLPPAPSPPAVGTVVIGPVAPPAPPAVPTSLVQAPAAAPAAPSSGESRDSTGQWTAERLEEGRIQLNMTYRHPGGGRSQHGNTYRESDFQGLGSGRDVRFELRRDAGTFAFEGRFDGTGPGSGGAGTFTFQGSPTYVREMAALGYEVEAGDLFSLALFDVSRQLIAELRQLGYDDLSLDTLVKFRIHGVSPDFIRALSEAGYANLSPDKLVSLKIHGATPEFAREMAELGYGDVPLDRLIEFRIHGVSPKFVRSLAEAGHEGIAASDLVAMRIHGVTAQFVREAEKRAGRKLSEREIISRKISGRY